ncbi:MAG: type II secretion system F family protein [Planctomycetaceae bacterium]|jgi:general secretion pathway protein F/type IV pilus assembly protein PilC|nr:type II secretion system F family protein [Planctomycetaceae bacterium]
MPEFKYSARNATGQKVEGSLNAVSEADAIASVTATGLFPIEIKPATSAALTDKIGRVSAQRMAAFYSQLADLLRGGVPLLRSLRILQEQSSNANLKSVLDKIYHRVEEGETLAEAMMRYPTVFGEMAIQMVRAGSEGGFLEESLEHVAHFTESQDDLKSRVTGAAAYPMVLAAFLGIVIILVLTVFVPKFDGLFEDLRAQNQLPLITDLLLKLGTSMQVIVPIGIPLMLIGLFALHRWSKGKQGRRFFDRVKIKLPIVGKLFEGFAVARFCRVLGTLLRNGVPILKSLDISADATGNKILGDTIQSATENISAGQRLAAPLAESKIFPTSVVEMISVAEESNTLDSVLIRIADSLEKRNWRQLDVAVRFLEPLMLVVLGSVILVIVMAIMLPIFKMSAIV